MVQQFGNDAHNLQHVPMGKTETSVNGFLAAQNKEGLSLVCNGKVAGKIIIHKAIIVGQESLSSSDETIDRTVIISATPSMLAQPTAPPLVATVITGMTAMSMNQPIRPLPVPSTPTFIDYIHGGCEISAIVAIDFTGSNGDPRVPGTLHYHGNGHRNDYEKAILAVGNILSNFDSDKKFPVW